MVSASQWYVYIIRTQDTQLYTGITTDIQRRWQEHCSGKAGARYFRAHKPQAVVYLEEQPNRSSASKREFTIKSLSKLNKEKVISDFLQNEPELFLPMIALLKTSNTEPVSAHNHQKV